MSTVLITGASGGIGYELAKLFARDHHDLVLVARRAEKLSQVAAELQAHGVTVKTIVLDLALPVAPKFLYDQLQRENITIDILINNAGFGAFGEFAAMPEEEILGQIHLNITALTHLTRLFLPAMLQRHAGRIMNVASTAAFQPGPLMAVYYATKAYVLSFSEAIANEVRNIRRHRDLLLSRRNPHRIRRPRRHARFANLQTVRRHAGRARRPRRLSRPHARTRRRHFRRTQLGRSRICALRPAPTGHRNLALGLRESFVETSLATSLRARLSAMRFTNRYFLFANFYSRPTTLSAPARV